MATSPEHPFPQLSSLTEWQGRSPGSAPCGLQHGPLTPLFSTLAANLIEGTEKSTWPEGTAVLAAFLTPADDRWRNEARPRYQAAVAQWMGREPADLSCTALLNGARDILGSAAEYHRFINTEILPAAYHSELLFTRFYQNFIQNQDEPEPLAFLLGFDSFPIRAEKSLFHLSQLCFENPALGAYLLGSPARKIAEQMRSEAAPEGIDAGAWLSFAAHFEAHLGHYGHALFTLDFAIPVPASDPLMMVEMLRCKLRSRPDGLEGGNPFTRQHAAASNREAATQMMAARLKGAKKKLFRDLVDMAQKYAPIREDSLAELGQGWPVIRALLLALGGHCVTAGLTERPDDIFWLTEDESEQAARQLDQGRERAAAYTLAIQARRLRWQMDQRAALSPAPGHTTPETAQVDEIRQVSGYGVRAGKVTAEACVLRGPADIARMRPGCVMVIPAVTAGWSPLFGTASAILAASGNRRTPYSMIIREYGIPAVIGLGAAAWEIQDGQCVTVDGSTGTITLM